jgi:hypothetical protein
MIPAFNEHGCLPEGIHDCTMEETAQRFGVFQSSDRRPQLWDKFIEFMREAESCGLIDAVLLNGSFVTAENEPNDIDLVVLVSLDHDFSAEFQPNEYNLLSKREVHRRFGFDLLVAAPSRKNIAATSSSFNKCAWNRVAKRGY